MKWLWLLLIPVLAGLIWVRTAPTDPAYWHREPYPKEPGSYPTAGGYQLVLEQGETAPTILAALDTVIRQTPRTTAIAGSVEEGMITYITRSRLFGFPDYTTLLVRGTQVVIHGRLRFGGSDVGVNRRRIEGWIAKVDGISRP